ncbi:MAG: flagellar motor switch protein FliN [Deltaproteobacteria bacterium]|jgi:flagellar motor switch protein FliN|nr:flagellar motor switch protein FliN [Deltaproteobacteria bacterium]MBT4090637.1 flagellar motor switch protein FliN [Deltaproteobacteria bacterium]MBT4269082.1 flagellar motor switch protein FliN [Deltaproteobacteria bacterium]MBT4641257.1 flagellar motor switch protein FliN [Deltaproteobacteria bacterium]MBT6504227.1 flagellar motor switch protein FliN [Deltaproteobacteria bacterium]
MAEELDLSSLDGMDDIDWSDVEGELQKNKEMLIDEAEANKSVEMDELIDADETDQAESLGEVETDFLMDIPLRLTVEVGRTRLLIKNLLALETGSVVELKKRIGSPMNVLINDKLVAKGEIVVQNEKFGLKLTEIIEESKRILKLQEY